MLGRIAKNAVRQVVAAGIFFVFTYAMNRQLGKDGYAAFFLCWSAAQLVGAAASLGGYNLIVRGLALKLPLDRLLTKVFKLAWGQLLIVLLGAWVAQELNQGPFWACALMGLAVIVGAQASAFALGFDAFELFSAGELTQSVLQLVLCWVLSAWGLPGIAVGVLVAALFKLALLAWGLRARMRQRWATRQVADERGDGEAGHALKSYAHGLVQSAYLRGMPGVVAAGVGPVAFADMASLWALLDKCLAIVQGANQMIYPKLLAGEISPFKGLVINAFLCLGFSVASLGIAGGWGAWTGGWAPSAALLAVEASLPLQLLFAPLAFWLLGSTALLSRARYGALFACHAVNALALASVVPSQRWLGSTEAGLFAWMGAAFTLTALVAVWDGLQRIRSTALT